MFEYTHSAALVAISRIQLVEECGKKGQNRCDHLSPTILPWVLSDVLIRSQYPQKDGTWPDGLGRDEA